MKKKWILSTIVLFLAMSVLAGDNREACARLLATAKNQMEEGAINRQTGDGHDRRNQSEKAIKAYALVSTQGVAKLNTEIQKPEPEREESEILKAEGDRLAEKLDFKAAAEKYEKALSLKHRFSDYERLRMATVISWAGKYETAILHLTALLSENPSNNPARLQKARVMLWMGELDAAIRETEKILASQPDNQGALLVKANAFRHKRFYREADRLFRVLLFQADNFDVRSSQVYNYLNMGDRLKTNEHISFLKPKYPYEFEELALITTVRDRAFRPRIYGGLTFYSDRDDNRVTTYSTGTQFWLGNWRTNLDYQHVRAQAPDRSTESDEILLSTYARMPWYGGIGGGVGLARGGVITGRALVDFDVLYGSVRFLAAREAYSYTAELIDNNIRASILSVGLQQRPTDRISLRGSYTLRDFSDDNESHDIQASASFLIVRNPAASAGYRVRYLDFRRQSRGGYFDPSNFISNSIFLNLSFENRHLHGHIEPYIGYQAFERHGFSRSEIFYGATGSLGYRVTDRIAIEGTAEWGNHTAHGVGPGEGEAWHYGQLGLRLRVLF